MGSFKCVIVKWYEGVNVVVKVAVEFFEMVLDVVVVHHGDRSLCHALLNDFNHFNQSTI